MKNAKYLIILILLIICACNNKNDTGKQEIHHEHEENVKVQISDLALKNMAAEIRSLKLTSHTLYKKIPAKVINTAENKVTLYAPWGGTVESVNASLGEWKTTADDLLVIVRDPLPRMNLTTTGELLNVSSENFHEAVTICRRVKSKLKTLTDEYDRLSKINQNHTSEFPLVSTSKLLELKYEIKQQEEELKAQLHKLVLHGFDEAQLDRFEEFSEGKLIIEPTASFWINTLKHNGLWQSDQDNFFNALPEELRQRRWTVQCVAELFYGDYISDSAVTELKKEPLLLKNFTAVAALIQEGYSINQLAGLAKNGLFEEKITLRVPKDSCIENINVKQGQRVTRGEALIDLHDPKAIFFEMTARGSEKNDLRQALSENLLVEIEPLLKNTAQNYQNLQILSIITSAEDGSISALIPVQNKLLAERKIESKKYLSWDLVEGMGFYAKIPLNQMNKVYVINSNAVLQVGAEKIVLVREGESFVERKVFILHQDNEIAVLSSESDLSEGEPVVTQNAFEVFQALQIRKPGNNDEHHGHHHH